MKRLIVMSLGAVVAAAMFAPAGGAEAQPSPTRIQMVVHRVHVLDDADALSWGELTYRFRLQRGSNSCPGFWCATLADDLRLTVNMSATTSQVRGIHQVVGGSGATLALLPGDHVRAGLAGAEEDWDGPGIAFCPPEPALPPFDDDLCGAEDNLGVLHLAFDPPYTWGIGEHSVTVRNSSGDETFRVDFAIQSVGVAVVPGAGLTAATPRPSSTPRPSPTPSSRLHTDPARPRRHEP